MLNLFDHCWILHHYSAWFVWFFFKWIIVIVFESHIEHVCWSWVFVQCFFQVHFSCSQCLLWIVGLWFCSKVLMQQRTHYRRQWKFLSRYIQVIRLSRSCFCSCSCWCFTANWRIFSKGRYILLGLLVIADRFIFWLIWTGFQKYLLPQWIFRQIRPLYWFEQCLSG